MQNRHISISLIFVFCLGVALQGQDNSSPANSYGLSLPNQSVPPPISTTTGTFFDFGPNTNLVLLIEEIRALLKSGNLEKAEKITTEALARINQNEKNRFYLAQIRK